MSSILMIDSGIGGLSILQHIKQQLPKHNIHYLADYEAYPYGEKDALWLNERINLLVEALEKQVQADVVIIACNTASTLVLPSLRSRLKCPVVGVVPAIKTASELSQTKNIGLLATPGTVSRPYMNDLIERFANHCKVTRIGSLEMVHMAEQKLAGKKVDIDKLRKIIKPFMLNQCDQVVLGCTHFPLLQIELEQLDSGIRFINSGAAIANRTAHLLKDLPSKNVQGEWYFYNTASLDSSLIQQLKSHGFQYFQESFSHVHLQKANN